MKNFLLELKNGISKSNLSKKHEPLLNKLMLFAIVYENDEKYYLNKDYIFGILEISKSFIGFIKRLDTNSKDVMVEKKHLLNAKQGDLVIAKMLHKNKKYLYAKISYIIESFYDNSIVILQKMKKSLVAKNIKNNFTFYLEEPHDKLKKYPKNAILKVSNKTNKIIDFLGSIEDEKVDEKIALELYEKDEFFSSSCESEAKSFGDFVDKSMYPNRLDLTNLPFCTIDPIDAKDFDDGIYFDVKTNELYVAIADVSEYVYAFNSIDKEAKHRGFSIYFPHKSIPMLPRALSENICSLKPNEDRLAFCFKMKINPISLNVEEEVLLEVIINSKKRYSYELIDDLLEKKQEKSKTDEEIFSWLLPLHELIKKIRIKRLKKGYEFKSRKNKLILKKQKLVKTIQELQTPSHELIEDCMLLANKAGAKKIENGIFRNHQSPDFKKLQVLLQDIRHLGIDVNFQKDTHKLILNIQSQAKDLGILEDVDKLIIKSQKKARYDYYNLGHFGLGFQRYTHFTSPIRRYSDLILHRLLKAKLHEDKKINYYENTLQSICDSVSMLERESEKVEKEFIQRKYARWAKEKTGEKFKAIITEVDKKIIATLDDEVKGAKMQIIYAKDINMLQKVEIMIVEVDIVKPVIYAQITKVLNV